VPKKQGCRTFEKIKDNADDVPQEILGPYCLGSRIRESCDRDSLPIACAARTRYFENQKKVL